MQGMPARWGFEATIVPERLALADDPAWSVDLGTQDSSGQYFVEAGKFKCSIAQVAADNFAGAWEFTTYEQRWMPYAVLGATTLVLLGLLCVVLKKRDPV
jgi:hypothetical protein